MIGCCSGELCAEGSVSTNKYAINCSGLSTNTIQVKQILWPDHCVINRSDSLFHSSLTVLPSDLVIRKGYHCQASISMTVWLLIFWVVWCCNWYLYQRTDVKGSDIPSLRSLLVIEKGWGPVHDFNNNWWQEGHEWTIQESPVMVFMLMML